MVTQNHVPGLDIAKYTAAIMRKTWQNMMQIPLTILNIRLLARICSTAKKMIAVKKHHATNKRYLYLSDGWSLRYVQNSAFCQIKSMHENCRTSIN
jgi:hypothetical protein